MDGLWVPLVTPFDERGEVDLPALRGLAGDVLDVIAYNVPYRTGRGLGAAALLDLASTDGVVGLKQAVGAVDADTVHLLAGAPPSFSVLAGDDAFLHAMLLLGARGGITTSAHLATGAFASLVADGRAGRVAEARARAAALLPLVEALFAEPNPAVLKAVLHARGRIATPAVRMPLTAASSAGLATALARLPGPLASRDRLPAGRPREVGLTSQ